MIADGRTSDPKELIYTAISNLVESRRSGRGGAQALGALMTLVTPIKDDKWYGELRKRPDNVESGERLWYVLGAVLNLLARHHLWSKIPREVESGREFEEALDGS